MRLGISGLGVIAVVSLLVTAAPDRDASSDNHRGDGVDYSRSTGHKRTSRTHYTWPTQVATETSNSGSSNFVKLQFESRSAVSPETSHHRLLHPSHVRPLQYTEQKAKMPALAGFITDLPTSRQAVLQPQIFENIATQPVVWSANSSLAIALENKDSPEANSSVLVPESASRDSQEKLSVTLTSPLPEAIFSGSTLSSSPIRRNRGERETTLLSQRTESRDNYDDKRSTTNLNEVTKPNSAVVNVAKSAETMNHRTTTSKTMTTTRRRLLDKNFQNATKRYEVQAVRGTREFSKNKETTEPSQGQPQFRNGQGQPNVFVKSSGRTISTEANNTVHSGPQDLANYSATLNPTVQFQVHDSGSNEGTQRSQDKRAAKRFTADRTIAQPENHLPDEFVFVGNTLKKVETARSDKPFARDDTLTEQQGLTAKSNVTLLARKPEILEYSSVTEETSGAKQITSESTVEMPTIERPLLWSFETMTNTSSATVGAFSDNHKAERVHSPETPRTKQQQQQRAPSLTLPSLPFHLPYEIAVKDAVDTKDVITDSDIERLAIPVNPLTVPKSAYPVAKNLSQSSINLVDGKAKKKYYEIKPSLITEMDHGTNVEVTTVARRTFDKFLLPSVPSAIGKFGPYFLDEEDRRNVTERIGSTVQLDCKIGLLGHRKVTWLQHYKDSFRLLTVELESYSVDRRISLNFQYPNNWRLQIAYASLRDSGLYKCQVEIDQDRSLVKRYNVIITAPNLTITDDSGRPVSGERHLKAGSALKLRCEAKDVIQRLNESLLWMRGDETLTEDVSENRTTEIVNEKEITVIVSTLFVERATPRHAGNYSCVVPEKARTTIAVHVLNGELPAAVQHGSGVSTAVLNLWLIHLTASYGFFR